MSVDLNNKVAIVTGAGGAGGIGEAYALALSRAGAAVVVADLDGKGAQSCAEKITVQGGRAQAFTVDIRDSAQTADMADFAQREFGGVDILVNNAAYMKPVTQGLLDYPQEIWQLTLDINLTGTFNCIRAVAPQMIRRGGGRIVNQSSIGAVIAGHAYGISKLAVQGLTVCFADELGPHGITVNAIAPGAIDTPAGAAARNPMFDEYLKSSPMASVKLLGETGDLCAALLYFVSDAAAWVTGQVLRVDGGLVRRPA